MIFKLKKATVRKLTSAAKWVAGAVTTVSTAIDVIGRVKGWLSPAKETVKSLAVAPEALPQMAPAGAHSGLPALLVLAAVAAAAIVAIHYLGRHVEARSLD